MSSWSPYRLIDMMSRMDLDFVAEEIPECDLARNVNAAGCAAQETAVDAVSEAALELVSSEEPVPQKTLAETGERWNRKRIALVSGIAAAGSLAITGVVVLACRRHGVLRRAA